LSDSDKLAEVEGVDKFSAVHITQRWQTARAYFQTLGFLNDLGLPARIVRQVYQVFKDDAEAVLSDDPWALVQVDGVTFTQAEEVANRLGLPSNSPKRTRGAVLYTCKSSRSFGHLYLTTGQVFGQVATYLADVSHQDVAEALAALHKEALLVLDKETRPGTLAVYEPWFHQIEKEGASLILSRKTTAVFADGANDPDAYIQKMGVMGPTTAKAATTGDLPATVARVVEDWGLDEQLKLSDDQKSGVVNALLEPVSVLTGLPGTGKTTSLKAVVRTLRDCEIPFLLCAPTGIAAKNLANRTGARASTIHRAFSARGKKDGSRQSTYTGVTGDAGANQGPTDQGTFWGYDQTRPYPAEVVVVDEASMIDQQLLYRIMSCTAPNCRVVFVGDAAQLPSVGPGNVLRDLIASKRFPTVNLTQIFRQKDKETGGVREVSGIVKAAHAIYRGEVPDTSSEDFRLAEVGSEEKGLEVILKLAVKMYEKREGTFQILSPRHAGTLGVTNLNARLRELLNPKGPGHQEVKLGGDTIREDDRIMVVQNDYKRDIFNGDVGKVSRIDRKAKEVEIKIFGDVPLLVQIPFASVPKTLRLAYACTIHKAQGLEYDHIVMPVVDSFKHQLQRNLLYTAVTRARKRVILIGTQTALTKAVQNDREDLRNTLFVDRLLKD
jgi:exodeoxyribonuclease V alpha subunit